MTKEQIIDKLYSEDKISLEEYQILREGVIDIASQWKQDHERTINRYEILAKMIKDSKLNPLITG